jgi:dTDP-4-dehydrorhamnose reductase
MINLGSVVTVALIGADGMLAMMIRSKVPETVELLLYDLPDFDITSYKKVSVALSESQPDIIINCAAYTQVDACETNQDIAFSVNGSGPGFLADVAKNLGALLIHISTDFVFSGEKEEPYLEDDEISPLSVYGASKAQGEKSITDSGLQTFYIIRTSWLYGSYGSNFVETIARLASERDDLGIVSDQIGSPTFTGDLANLVWIFVKKHLTARNVVPYGIYHYSNEGSCSWYEFAQEIISHLKRMTVPLQLEKLRAISTEEYPLPAKRPAYSVLSKKKTSEVIDIAVPFWRDSLAQYMELRGKQGLKS